MSELEVLKWGRLPYSVAHRRQLERLEERRNGLVADALILCEHDSVITAGRGYRQPPPDDLPYPLVDVERGGLLTYHGPGQLVGYPIILLDEPKRDIHKYIENVERGIIEGLAILGLNASGRGGGGFRGVWVGPRKIASIGIAVKRWVTYHGFALNVTTDLEAFQGFDPCGFEPDIMTNLEREMDEPPDWNQVEEAISMGMKSCLTS